MLDQLRQGAQGWVSKVLMGLLVLSFAIWGIGGFAGLRRRNAGDRRRRGGQRAGVRPRQTSAQRSAQQAGQQVRSRAGAAAAPPETPRSTTRRADYNLGVSDDRVATRDRQESGLPAARRQLRPRALHRAPRAMPASTATTTSRDDAARAGARPDRRHARRRDRGAAAHGGGALPLPERGAHDFLRRRRRDVDRAGRRAGRQPTCNAYFDENKDSFRAPEYRKLALLTLDPATIADPDAVTDEEVAAEYERRKASFTRPERRRIEQIRFATTEAAEAALKQIEGGADFAAIADGERRDDRRRRPRPEDQGRDPRSGGRPKRPSPPSRTASCR